MQAFSKIISVTWKTQTWGEFELCLVISLYVCIHTHVLLYVSIHTLKVAPKIMLPILSCLMWMLLVWMLNLKHSTNNPELFFALSQKAAECQSGKMVWHKSAYKAPCYRAPKAKNLICLFVKGNVELHYACCEHCLTHSAAIPARGK